MEERTADGAGPVVEDATARSSSVQQCTACIASAAAGGDYAQTKLGAQDLAPPRCLGMITLSPKSLSQRGAARRCPEGGCAVSWRPMHVWVRKLVVVVVSRQRVG
jgi:hypothetical protein